MKLQEIEGEGPPLLGFLAILFIGLLVLSCSNPMNYTTSSGANGKTSIPSPPPGGPPYTVTYFDFTVNTSGSTPVDSNSYAAGATVTVLGNVGVPPLSWAGFTFKGWNTMQTVANNLDGGNGGTFYAPGATFEINSNLYLFGVWQ
jgi:hypothetical protein